MEVANPIYDAVFKYLMEDDCVARTILSALLKKDVLNVEMRPHEYKCTHELIGCCAVLGTLHGRW